MATPSLKQAQSWFEEKFLEVHIYDPKTHPPTLAANVCPNNTPYITIAGGILHLEGDEIPKTAQPISNWYKAVDTLWELMGRPKYLWWRHMPELEDGRVYSRLIMTHRGPYQSYTGHPISKLMKTT